MTPIDQLKASDASQDVLGIINIWFKLTFVTLGQDGLVDGPEYCFPVCHHVTPLCRTLTMAVSIVTRWDSGRFSVNLGILNNLKSLKAAISKDDDDGVGDGGGI